MSPTLYALFIGKVMQDLGAVLESELNLIILAALT